MLDGIECFHRFIAPSRIPHDLMEDALRETGIGFMTQKQVGKMQFLAVAGNFREKRCWATQPARDFDADAVHFEAETEREWFGFADKTPAGENTQGVVGKVGNQDFAGRLPAYADTSFVDLIGGSGS